MKKYIITIGCALVAQITHAEDGYEYADRLMRQTKQFESERNERQLRDSIERIERIERQLEADRRQLEHDHYIDMLKNM